jgi:hypothetical protein
MGFIDQPITVTVPLWVLLLRGRTSSRRSVSTSAPWWRTSPPAVTAGAEDNPNGVHAPYGRASGRKVHVPQPRL